MGFCGGADERTSYMKRTGICFTHSLALKQSVDHTSAYLAAIKCMEAANLEQANLFVLLYHGLLLSVIAVLALSPTQIGKFGKTENGMMCISHG